MGGVWNFTISNQEKKVYGQKQYFFYLESLSMNDPRQRHGNHTWDMVLHYYQCPQCGYINESRHKFVIRDNALQKDLTCARCRNHFQVTKKMRRTFGPLLGHNLEIDD